ncbi:MAG: L-histidine N(alpha)-methyltransferase [Acidobacteria bacterium]|nr:L-histidine N(alpha)-methyltransferase [Acidobacteriota bacterium]
MSRVDGLRLASAHVDVDAFAREVQYYLSLTPRQLPSRYLYDALGSSLFEAICHLPWYPITRAERHLIETYRHDILDFAKQPRAIIELGSGNGEKLALLLQDAQASRTAHLIDVSATALAAATSRLSDIPAVTIVTHQDQYEEGLNSVARLRPRGESALALFLGSNIGNFDQPDAEAFLGSVRTSLRSGDTFLIGADLVKPEPMLLAAYDDPLGVTAAFDRNLLVRLNHELGANFDLAGFVHRAVWNAEQSRVEMHLESRCRQAVAIPRAQLNVTFEAGERIWTESSYKYEPVAFEAMLQRAGFAPGRRWIDPRSRFLLSLCRVN